MKSTTTAILLCILFFSSCKKIVSDALGHYISPQQTGQYIKYTIHQGNHYADHNVYKTVNYDELKFIVRFDSTAIYQTADPGNQEDINKLYGFSDNNADHQQYSARFGWNWARGALRLYAYTYNNGVRTEQEITSVQIRAEYNCSIKVNNDKYIFSVNSSIIEMPRNSATAKGEGYKLYPYFGGDETAPHDISIIIKEL